ncbi:hypothetical protein GZL_02840 [Streptomyces sp. 769]|nr:hypothetical protein GZL_02840 [Streptomyces sp. 769]
MPVTALLRQTGDGVAGSPAGGPYDPLHCEDGRRPEQRSDERDGDAHALHRDRSADRTAGGACRAGDRRFVAPFPY